MNALLSKAASFLLAAHVLSSGKNHGARALMVGDEVCITNYMMDNFCIGLGHFKDDDSWMTLANPEEHSFHCLLDVEDCWTSGYVVLTDKNEETGMHCIGYQLPDTQAILDAGFAAGRDDGYCTGCTGDETKPTKGWRATIKGTVKELGDGSDSVSGAPILENIQVLDESVGCGDNPTVVEPVCLPPPPPAPVMVGDEVCITNYMMDNFCIGLGHFKDDDSWMTLANPEEHSFHCLLDVEDCWTSGYVVLTDKNEETGMHCIGYQLPDTQAILDAGFAAGRDDGYCTGCTGDDSKPTKGWRATIKGTVTSLGDGSNSVSGAPVLGNIQVLDASEECDIPTVVNPVCLSDDTPAAEPVMELPSSDCTTQMCEEQLSDDLLLKYQINVPEGTTYDVCEGCTVTMELTYDGEAWVSIGFSEDGQMVGSEAVIGGPENTTPQKYLLASKGGDALELMDEQTLTDADVKVENGQTIMTFTKIMKEEGEIEITTGVNTFLWAHGSSPTLGYHGFTNKASFDINFGVSAAPSTELKVGDEVCTTNYMMDNFCIGLGHFKDDDSWMTLASPEEHSFHCLLDVEDCWTSGYVVLTDKNEETGMHCIGYQLPDTQAILDAGFAAGRDDGYCTGCTGDETTPTKGWRATIKGTVKELGDGSDSVSGAPILENIQVLDESVGCGDNPTVVEPVCLPPPPPAPVMVGDEVCITNYMMDNFCIGLGHFKDDDSWMTLASPEEHSFHCLLDVEDCWTSGYVVLTDKNEETGMHCIGYQLPDTQAILDAGFAAGRDDGYCTGCTGDDSKPTKGWRATIKGTVTSLGDGSNSVSGAPVLGNIQVLDASEECDIPTVVNPVCLSDDTETAPVMELPTRDCSTQMCEEQLSDDYLLKYQINVPEDTTEDVCEGCTVTMELTYDGEAWVSIGFSEDGQMVGSEAVIGGPENTTPQKYLLASKGGDALELMPEDQQTLTEASVRVENGQTIMTFTKIMKEEGEIEITTGNNMFIWAHGTSPTFGYHGFGNKAAFDINLSSGAAEAATVPNKSAWLAHGIMAFLAWGVLVPFAVQSSLLRDLLPKGPIWFQLHRAFNATSYALSIALFAVAVAYINKEDAPHWSTNHAKMGLAMFILASLQVVGGAFRPHLPAPDSDEAKTSVRKGWEVGHRVAGVALLASGFWQMSEGIKLYSMKYFVSESDEDKVTIAYWVWVGVMAAIIVLGGGYFKLRNKDSDDAADQAPEAEADAEAQQSGVVMPKSGEEGQE